MRRSKVKLLVLGPAALVLALVPVLGGAGPVAYGASTTPQGSCKQLTKAQIQPLVSVPITKVTITKVLTGQQCIYLGSGGAAIDVIVVPGSEAKQSFDSDVSGFDGKVTVSGVAGKTYREKGDFQIDSLLGNVFCSVSVGAGDTVPGVGAIQEANGGTSTLPESDNATVATALGTICDRIFKKGNTKVSLAALGSTTATTAAGGSAGSLKPPGTTQSTKTIATDPEKVTFVKLTDPAVPTDPDNAANPGMRWVGLQFKIVVDGPDSVGGTGFVIGADGVTYGFNSSEIIGPVPGCTPTENTPEGKPWTICTGTMMPTGVSVAKVVFSGTGTNQSGTGVLYWSPS